MSAKLTPLFRSAVPDAFSNMTAMSEIASDCRIGPKDDPTKLKSNAFSGVTAVADFCAHSHRDSNNMDGGLTMVVTLLKPENRAFGSVPSDEQLHVLPHYMPDHTDEFDNAEEQERKVRDGALEKLTK